MGTGKFTAGGNCDGLVIQGEPGRVATLHVSWLDIIYFSIQVPEDIRPVTESNTLVYYKYFSTDAVADELEVKTLSLI